MKRGRPKNNKQIETLNFTTYQQDITIFKNSINDFITNEETENKSELEFVKKFLTIETWKQNLFIVYLLNKDQNAKSKTFTFTALAELLQVDRAELMRTIKQIKKELTEL